MTVEEMVALFSQYTESGEFLKFRRVRVKIFGRPDLHAFALLDSLVPGTRDMVSDAEHGEIYLEVRPDALAAVVHEEEIIDLVRCGVRYDDALKSLAMFV